MLLKTHHQQIQLDWVLIAKGIGIILVVIGHFIPEFSPEYWIAARNAIYSFHMPLFFLLSGYLYSPGKYTYVNLIENKVRRLLYPFLSTALVFYAIKLIAGKFVRLDYPVASDSFYVLLTNPVNSYMPLLWFVHALFLIFVAYPLFRLFIGSTVILVALVCINAIFGSDFLIVGKALANMPFFVAGALLKEKDNISKMVIGPGWRFIAVSVLVFFLVYLGYTNLNNEYPVMFFAGVAGSLLVINISHAITASHSRAKSILLPIGLYSMSIYLLHPLFESSVRICFLGLFKGIDLPFAVVALAAIGSGILFPFLLEKYVLRNIVYTRKYFLGMN